MATCTYCGSTIVFGGVQEGDLRFISRDDDCAPAAGSPKLPACEP